MADPSTQPSDQIEKMVHLLGNLDSVRAEENEILSQLDVLWYAMTPEQQKLANEVVQNREKPVAERDALLRFLQRLSYQHRPKGFTLKSGRASKHYVDVRLTAVHPLGAKHIGAVLYDTVRRVYPNAVAGVALGGVPLAVAISIESAKNPDAMLPTIIVRKKAKGHGADNGSLLVGQQNLPTAANKVVLVEDVATTGGSILRAAEALVSEGFQIAMVLALVDRQEGAREAIEGAGYPFTSIYTLSDVAGHRA